MIFLGFILCKFDLPNQTYAYYETLRRINFS